MFGWGVTRATTEELADRMQAGKVVLIDVREGYEFSAGHVPGAVNIPLGQLSKRLDWLDPTAETFLICASGSRSATAARRLTKAGFSAVYSVSGGTAAWRGKLKK